MERADIHVKLVIRRSSPTLWDDLRFCQQTFTLQSSWVVLFGSNREYVRVIYHSVIRSFLRSQFLCTRT